MLSGSFPIFALSNHTTFSQTQTDATVPLKEICGFLAIPIKTWEFREQNIKIVRSYQWCINRILQISLTLRKCHRALQQCTTSLYIRVYGSRIVMEWSTYVLTVLLYLTKKREGALTLRKMGSTRVGGMGEGQALQVGSKISSCSAAEEEATLPWSNQEDWKKSPAWWRRPIVHRVRNYCEQLPFLYVNSKIIFHDTMLDISPSCLLCFRRINHKAINHLHSSSDVQSNHVGYTYNKIVMECQGWKYLHSYV